MEGSATPPRGTDSDAVAGVEDADAAIDAAIDEAEEADAAKRRLLKSRAAKRLSYHGVPPLTVLSFASHFTEFDVDTILEELDFDGYVTVHLLAKIMMSFPFITEDSGSKKRKREGVETRSVTTMYHTHEHWVKRLTAALQRQGWAPTIREEPRWDAPESRQEAGDSPQVHASELFAVVRSHPMFFA